MTRPNLYSMGLSMNRLGRIFKMADVILSGNSTRIAKYAKNRVVYGIINKMTRNFYR